MADRNLQNIKGESLTEKEMNLLNLNKKWWYLYSQVVDRSAKKIPCMPGYLLDISTVPFELKEYRSNNKTLGEFGKLQCESSHNAPSGGSNPKEQILTLHLEAAQNELQFTWEIICEENELNGRESAVLLWMIDYTNRRTDFTEHMHHAYMAHFEYFDSYFRKLSVKSSDVAKALSISTKEAYKALCTLTGKGLLFKQNCSPIPDDRKCLFSLVHSIFDELFPERYDDVGSEPDRPRHGLYPSGTCSNPTEGPGLLLGSTITLDDVILPDSTREEMITAIAQVKHGSTIMDDWGLGEVVQYGRGVIVLLCGPPGTGKTMSALALSGELKKSLYKVEYQKLVSMFFGETEKNIHEAFQKAAENDYILFLDEADSVLTNRTSVNSSGDAAHNRDTNVLLRELEKFEGVAVLTTNLANVLDRALSRRLNLTVHFDMPDKAARRKIWEKHLPAQAPLSKDLDVEALAEHPLSGGDIKNAVLIGFRIAASRIDGAFDQVEICMEDFLMGVEHEQRKTDIMKGGKSRGIEDVYIEVA